MRGRDGLCEGRPALFCCVICSVDSFHFFVFLSKIVQALFCCFAGAIWWDLDEYIEVLGRAIEGYFMSEHYVDAKDVH